MFNEACFNCSGSIDPSNETDGTGQELETNLVIASHHHDIRARRLTTNANDTDILNAEDIRSSEKRAASYKTRRFNDPEDQNLDLTSKKTPFNDPEDQNLDLTSKKMPFNDPEDQNLDLTSKKTPFNDPEDQNMDLTSKKTPFNDLEDQNLDLTSKKMPNFSHIRRQAVKDSNVEQVHSTNKAERSRCTYVYGDARMKTSLTV